MTLSIPKSEISILDIGCGRGASPMPRVIVGLMW